MARLASDLTGRAAPLTAVALYLTGLEVYLTPRARYPTVRGLHPTSVGLQRTAVGLRHPDKAVLLTGGGLHRPGLTPHVPRPVASPEGKELPVSLFT